MLKKTFYDKVRASVFGGFLEQSQVEGIEAVLQEWDDRRLSDKRWLAYILATDRHETNARMQPVRENLNYTTAAQIRKTWPSRFVTDADARPYVKNPKALAIKVYGGRLGNAPAPSEDGWTYRGDGLPQLTGKANFDKFGVEPGMDLRTSVEVMFDGMINGKFTGRKLSDYFSDTKADPIGARAIINPDKNGQLVARYYGAFLEALTAAENDYMQADSVHPDPSPAQVADDVPVAKSGAALTVGGATAAGLLTAGGTAATAAISGISNQWALAAFGMVLVTFLISGGVGLWLWQSGRLTISK